MQLPNLRLFGNVPITRDYSVVHDMDPWTWFNQLMAAASVTKGYEDAVNYYRLPDRIRIEGVYDDIRQMTYGCLSQDVLSGGTYVVNGYAVLQRPLFFWVDTIRLVKAASYETDNSDPLDVIELTITPDVWSNCNGQWELHDSYVVRRHVDRWTYDSDSSTYSDNYHPNAAGEVDGAFNRTLSTELTPMKVWQRGVWSTGDDITARARAIIVSALATDGSMKYYIGLDCVLENGTVDAIYYQDYDANLSIDRVGLFFNFSHIASGLFYTETGITADNVQSITVIPIECIPDVVTLIRGHNELQVTSDNVLGIDMLQGHIGNFRVSGSTYNAAGEYLLWLEMVDTNMNLIGNMVRSFTVSPANPYVPDTSVITSTTRSIDQEPMLYRYPAVKRAIVNGIGGEITEIPDVDALVTNATVLPIPDPSRTTLEFFAGSDIFTANGKGSVGKIEAPTLPIFNSAWMSYKAINKVGDEISYSAQQASNVGGGIATTIMGAVGGFMMGGPAGAGLGAASGVASTALGYHSTKENLRAKQITIKNSPCTVVDLGNGMGALSLDLIAYHYMAVRIDEVSFDKLDNDYYWRGYFVNRFFNGTVSLDTREYFDFVLTDGARIRGTLNAEDAAAIGGILDNGVTIVHEASWLLSPDTTKNNRENSLI